MLTNAEMQDRGYRGLFSDVYRMLQDHGDPKSDGEWTRLVDAANGLGRKHKGVFATAIITAVVREIERASNV